MLEVPFFIMGLGLVLYVLTGGADFGGGFWHLVASGPNKRAQRSAVEHAIAPIWEANHVWLIFVIVLMFTSYPRAFAVMSVAFHVPLVVALVGIVLRGASFVFKSYGLGPSDARARWGHVFAWASVVTPVFFGMVLAGASSGAIVVEAGAVTSGFFAGWTSAFAILTGLFALALFALLAATYLTVDGPREVRDDFRRRALVTELVAGALALAVFVVAGTDAPRLRERLAESTWFWPLQGATALAAVGVVGLLLVRQVRWQRWARVAAAAQVVSVVLGWGAAMRGDVILGAVRIADAGGRIETLRGVLPALAGGTLLLVPSLIALFRIFRAAPEDEERG